MDENVSSQWANVETQYQRRADLIPNLVNTVKGYASHEKETLEGVVEARSKATQIKVDANDLTPEKLAEYQKAQGAVTSALGKLIKTSLSCKHNWKVQKTGSTLPAKTLTMLHKHTIHLSAVSPKASLLLYSASRNVPISKPPKERKKHRK